MQEGAGKPSPEEIAAAMEISVERVREIMKIAQEPVSLETPIGEEEDSHLGDFIEEERTAVGMLEKAETVLVGAGKAAFFVTEKFAFHQVFGNCAAVHRDKRADGTRRQFVYAAGGLLFTRTGFAGNVNRHVTSGQAAD